MQNFGFYFGIGWDHIIARDALDHLLFVLALSAIYVLGNWKQVLILVTAFTIGHSLTLALSVYDVIRVNDKWVEFLIPCTIIVTAAANLFEKDFNPKKLRLNYFFALFFGLIHGLGFANAIRFMIIGDESLGWSLFGFNIGLEAGQIAVVIVILLMSHLIINVAGLKRKWWVWSLSLFAIIIALDMAWKKFLLL
ncbi:MAG TPA: HupE/UreJ family protein [Ferruginibacter sp.]|nr:HupE/UreJ family protein [Ferruginibacter sp.]